MMVYDQDHAPGAVHPIITKYSAAEAVLMQNRCRDIFYIIACYSAVQLCPRSAA